MQAFALPIGGRLPPSAAVSDHFESAVGRILHKYRDNALFTDLDEFDITVINIFRFFIAACPHLPLRSL